MPDRRHATSPSVSFEHRATVAAGFVTGLVAGMASRGVDPRPLLRSAGIPASVLHDRNLRVAVDDYVALYNAVVDALDDEGFGLFSRPVPRGSFEFLVRGALGSAHLAEALARISRFLALVLPDLAVEIAGPCLVIRERIPLRPMAGRVFAYEWLLRLVHGVACWLVARPLALVEVTFPFAAPQHSADYALVYTEHAAFGGDALVATIDASALELPIRRVDSDVTPFMEGAPGKIGILYRRDRELARDVRAVLARSLGASPTLASIARELGLSTRTLHRRLEAEGTSFRQLKDALRRETALAQLRTTRASVADIASALGYSEPSAFFRAFRNWTGEAPSRHRRRHAGRPIGSK